MYEKAVRLAVIPFPEDEAFRKALHRVDARIRKSPNVKVYTSSRLQGKVDFGFSRQLQHWADMNQNNQHRLVESLFPLLIRFENKKALRRCWELISKRPSEVKLVLNKIAEAFFVDQNWLWNECLSASFFGVLWENVELKIQNGLWIDHYRPVKISEAITHLHAYLNTYSFPKTSIL